ncbi:MAG: DEAD/DEAH box helicase [Lachnospiraceae bacterium]|nr:DEAD/DEAH box helicase [Ruminococcus sp.]MCM1275614.1 DEAD/DEAH box helicase [Lachnospiraceae bacterium]
MTDIKRKAREALLRFLGEGAEFRDGQYEAIEATLTNKRTLVVQRTGWGKSLVYFIAAKLLKGEYKATHGADAKPSVSIIISPLLVLMDNQVASINDKFELNCAVLNSRSDKDAIIRDIKNNNTDILFTTPETLFSTLYDEIANSNFNINFFVIDEAHCISDWGYDFRLKYSSLRKVIEVLPPNVPVLATTATANDRVIADLEKQLGGDVFISRGELMRDNLYIQVLKLNSKTERYAWILDNLDSLEGSGIIYCLTTRDCDDLTHFLNKNREKNDIRAYYSDKTPDKDDPGYDPSDPGKYSDKNNPDKYNIETERLFAGNKIKAVVATVKLGMGYDKKDIAFVIHYQTPADIVKYYQQIGRAGRAIDRAYTFLMHGKEDDKIHKFFRRSAFPTREEATEIYDLIKSPSEHGLAGQPSVGDIETVVNFSHSRVEKALTFLENEGYIVKRKSDKQRYFPVADSEKVFTYNEDLYSAITKQRIAEYDMMKQYLDTDKCYNRFVVNALDDPTEKNCGICDNCKKNGFFSTEVSEASKASALDHFEGNYFSIELRKRFPYSTSVNGAKFGLELGAGQTVAGRTIDKLFRDHSKAVPAATALCLSQYGMPTYGELVKQGKYVSKRFDDRLVDKSAEILAPIIREKSITAVTCVPSLRSGIVPDFTGRLAAKLGIPFVELLTKSESEQQKEQQNSVHQFENAYNSFSLRSGCEIPQKLLLVDDMIDSGWTLGVCDMLLKGAGAELILPYALAETKGKDDEE